ncbi:MAG: metallophosphoesterase family protein [Aeoliella sp.]
MIVGVLADTHDEIDRTREAIYRLLDQGVQAIFHCGDITTPEIIKICSQAPLYFTFGNHDSDDVPSLKRAAEDLRVRCLE